MPMMLTSKCHQCSYSHVDPATNSDANGAHFEVSFSPIIFVSICVFISSFVKRLESKSAIIDLLGAQTTDVAELNALGRV